MAPSVSRLFRMGSPSAVAWLVVSVVVWVAVNGVEGRWLASHVGQEVLEGVDPSFTDANPTASVIVPIVRRWVVAAGFHGEPRAIFSAISATSLAVVVSVASAEHMARTVLSFSQKTATGASVAASKVATIDYGSLAAIADTQPADFGVSARRGGPVQHRQAPESLPGQLMHGHSIAGG